MPAVSMALAEELSGLPVGEIAIDLGPGEIPEALPPCRCPCGWTCTCG